MLHSSGEMLSSVLAKHRSAGGSLTTKLAQTGDPDVVGGGVLRLVPVRALSAGALIALLGLILVLPGAAFLSYMAMDVQRERIEITQSLGHSEANYAADRLDSEIATLETLVSVFARSGWLEEDALQTLHRRARAALVGQDRHLIVLNETGQQLLNTRVPWGTQLGVSSHAGAIAMARGEDAAPVSNFFTGRIAGELVFNVLRRVDLPDGRRRVLILTRNAETLEPLVLNERSSARWNVELRDAEGTAAFRYGPQADLLADDWNAKFANAAFSVTQPLGKAPWDIVVWGSTNLVSYATPFNRAILIGGIAWFALALATALGVGLAISRSIKSTAQFASALGSGAHPSATPSVITEVNDIRQALEDAAHRLSERDAERRMILNETAHRARNQMGLAIAMVNLTARTSTDVDEMKASLGQRLNALGRAIDVAESSSGVAPTLRSLAENQLAPFIDGHGHRFTFEGDNILVGRSAGQSLALVLHELATNATKHGAWSVPGGHIRLVCLKGRTEVAITWTETGRAASPPTRKGFGSQLLHSIVELGFGGSYERDFTPEGMIFRMTAPISSLEGR